MQAIKDLGDLEALYGAVVPAALAKVSPHVTPRYRQWIEASRFVVLTTVGPEGTDASPRGDDGCVVRVVDQKTLWLPDWQGNNRIDSLRNIVRDGRASLMFMVPGCNDVVRVNGKAILTAAGSVTAQFEKKGKHPKTVVVINVDEVYFQCAKALIRSGLWKAGDESDRVPSAGQFIEEFEAGFEAEAFDAGYSEYASDRLW